MCKSYIHYICNIFIYAIYVLYAMYFITLQYKHLNVLECQTKNHSNINMKWVTEKFFVLAIERHLIHIITLILFYQIMFNANY